MVLLGVACTFLGTVIVSVLYPIKEFSHRRKAANTVTNFSWFKPAITTGLSLFQGPDPAYRALSSSLWCFLRALGLALHAALLMLGLQSARELNIKHGPIQNMHYMWHTGLVCGMRCMQHLYTASSLWGRISGPNLACGPAPHPLWPD